MFRKFLIEKVPKPVKKRFNDFWEGIHPKNINIRARFLQRRRKAKILKEAQDIQADKQLESDEIKKLGEELDKIEQEEDIEQIDEDEEFDDQEDSEYYDFSYQESVQRRLQKHFPTQVFELHEYRDIPNTGIIRITRPRDVSLEMIQMPEKVLARDKISLRERYIQFMKKSYKLRYRCDEEDRQEYLKQIAQMSKPPKEETQNIKVAIDSIKDTVKENMDKNIVLQKSKDVVSKIKEKMNNEVYQYMLENYPDFDIEIFEQEIEYIFTDVFNSYLNHDLNSIKDTCLSEAYGFFQSQIEVETQKNAQMHKMKKKQQKVNPIKRY